jgi:peptidoglycan hydrolase-like protein with peptidoglycan-binding domain
MGLARHVLHSRVMHTITPCQRKISDRFPVASFVVNVPPNRLFEIVCTTDPQLLSAEYRGRRTAHNFFTSRSGGLLRAPAGHATYLVPTEQLKRFAGQSRIYYALASYESPRGDDVKLSVTPGIVGVPSIQLSSDFTGRSLDRSRIRGGARDGKYGGPTTLLTWGGDGVSPPTAQVTSTDYDDGFSSDLWTSATTTTTTATAMATASEMSTERPDEGVDPDYVYDEPGLGEAYGRREGSVITSARRTAAAEPEGFEDAAALRSAGASYGRVATTPSHERNAEVEDMRHLLAYGHRGSADEPPGIEDVRQLARYGAADAEPAGAESVPPAMAAVLPPATTHAFDVPGRGVDASWAEDDDEPDLVPTPTVDGEPLTIRRKAEILRPAAANESGDKRYSAVLGSIEHDDPTHPAYQRLHHGLHWGLVLFTQRSGTLGKVLGACERRDSAQFRQTFGAAYADRLVQVTTASSPDARLAPVAASRLWSPEWMEKFKAAGAIPAFQAAQNEVAIEHYFDRNLGFASALGLMTDRALAMVFDRAIHMGLAGARQWILQAVSPLVDGAQRDAALAALGHTDVAAFQRAAGLEPTGSFGTQTHAALLGALRQLGERAPFSLPSATEMLDKLVTAAAGRRFEQRARALRSDSSFTDAVQRIV